MRKGSGTPATSMREFFIGVADFVILVMIFGIAIELIRGFASWLAFKFSDDEEDC